MSLIDEKTLDEMHDIVMDEFEIYMNDFISTHQEDEIYDKNTICCSWLIQKIANLQALVMYQQQEINNTKTYIREFCKKK